MQQLNPVSGKGHEAKLDGGFWQIMPETLDEWSDEALEQETYRARHEAQMDTIVVQYGASIYDHEARTYYGFCPNTAIPMHPKFEGRDPIGAIMRGAEANNMKVILGGPVMPFPFEENWTDNIREWSSPRALDYRLQYLQRYASYQSFYGYYTPNEPNFSKVHELGFHPEPLLETTIRELDLIRKEFPKIHVVKCIGLYSHQFRDSRGEMQYSPCTFEDLDPIWRPWVQHLSQVDAWMIIDGVGTRLSDHYHTDMAQQWCAGLCAEFGKEYWTDVESGWMFDENNLRPIDMEVLAESIRVAAKHASKIVTFDYLHYMSALSPKEPVRRLHGEYLQYLNTLKQPRLNRQSPVG